MPTDAATPPSARPLPSVPVRFSPALSLSRQPTNSLRLSGKGSVTLSSTQLVVRGRRNRFFGLGAAVEAAFPLEDIVNVQLSERLVRFDVQSPAQASVSMQFWARDADTARAIALALPATVTPSARRAQAEMVAFAALMAANRTRVWVTPTLIALNVGVFIAAAVNGAGVMQPDGEVLLRLGTNYGPLTLSGQWWRLPASMFLHFGLVHLALNMWALFNGGRLAERLYGSAAFLIVYITAGLCGALASVLWNPNVNSAGASGAIFGVFAALLAFFLRKHSAIPQAVVRQQQVSGLSFIGYNLMFGFANSGIDNAAHIGGLISGLVVGFLLARPLDTRTPAPRLMQASGVLVAAALCAGLWWIAAHPDDQRRDAIRLRADLAWMTDLEQRSIASFNDGIDQLHAQQITPAQFADRIERDVLPNWEAIEQRLKADEPAATSTSQPLWQACKHYVDSRRDSARLYVSGIRDDRGDDIDRANALRQQGDADLARMHELDRD